MELYGSYTSPFVRHCRIALIQTGLDWELVETDLSAASVGSPTKKIPYLKDGDVTLTDSSSILKHIREKADEAFLPSVRDYELFCLVNTAMDASITIFLCERMDALTAKESKYLARQQARVESTLQALDSSSLPTASPLTDGQIRLACFLAWGLYRKRFSLQGYPHLAAFLAVASDDAAFERTAPPSA